MLYDEPLKLNALRSDLVFYPVPFDKIVAEVCKDAKLRRLVKNMIYDGVLSKLLHVDMAQMEHALRRQLGKKLKAMELNLAALEAGYAYAEEHLVKRDPYWVEPMDKTRGMILIEGNAAAALGCMFAGVTVIAWYPITPSSSLPESLIGYHEEVRHEPETGQGDLRRRAGGGRDRGDRHGRRRRLGRRARDDLHVRAGHLADGRVRGPGVLRGGARRRVRHPARRAVDRTADAHGAGRHARARAAVARRHEAHHAHPGVGRRVLPHVAWMRSTSPSASRPSCS